MNNIAIVLAAGKGSRMKSNIPKPLQLINGKTMVYTIVKKLYDNPLIQKILVVVGNEPHKIISNLDDFNSKIDYIVQHQQLGTGHAVKCCKSYLSTNYPSFRSLILFADSPLLTEETLNTILKTEGNVACICKKENPTGSGRIILENGTLINSIEEKDCTEEQKKIKLVNLGIYLLNNSLICTYIDNIKNENKQKEYYLPDLMLEIIKKGHIIKPLEFKDTIEFINVNTPKDLGIANGVKYF